MPKFLRIFKKNFPSKGAFLLSIGLFLLSGCAEKPLPPVEPEQPSVISTAPLPSKSSISSKDLLQPPSIFKIALLLPLTGEKKDLGNALLKASELSIFENTFSSLEILIGNTEGQENGATEALSDILKNHEIDLILGPLMADDVAAITPLAWEKAIPVLSFSNMPQVAGDNIFIMGFSPEEQMEHVIHFALSQNITHFLIIAPAGEYGRLIARAVRKGLYESSSAKIKDIIYYDPSGADLEEKLKTLNLADVQAVVIPEGGPRLLEIINFLKKDPLYSILKPRLIGSGQWDDSTLLQNPLLQGAWFAGTRSNQWENFADTYQEAYGENPPRLASLGYDAIMVANDIQTSQNSVHQCLLRPQGFQGIEGTFHFTPQGHIIRDWRVLEITLKSPKFFRYVDKKGL